MSFYAHEALRRCGLLFPARWEKIAETISMQDDIILGLDTNLLYNCSITQYLLPAVGIIEPKGYMHTPNWVLLVVPGTVMYELEEAADQRDSTGKLSKIGRNAFRALQEIIELSENVDIPGVSLLIHGESDPALDTKGYLEQIRRDLFNIFESSGNLSDDRKHGRKGTKYRRHKSSMADMMIRGQFKSFLSQMDFHKGTYFLTADKTNSALAQAEGLNPIYLGYSGKNKSIEGFSVVNEDNGEKIQFHPSLGNLIYEMAVSFGQIVIQSGDLITTLECDRKGESLGRWLNKQLRIHEEELKELLHVYHGRFDLEECANIWKKLINKFEEVDWLVDIEDEFLASEGVLELQGAHVE